MNPHGYLMSVNCSVCGCEGGVSVKHAASRWMVGSNFIHEDARVCANNLKEKNKQLEKQLQNGR